MEQSIEFYFFYGSLHSYLSVMRIEARTRDVVVHWHPFNLREIIVEQTGAGYTCSQAKMSYFWHDIERRATRHGLPFAGAAPYPVDPDLLALKVGAVAAQEGWCAEYSRAVFKDWFLNKRAPGVGDRIEQILVSLNKSPVTIIRRAKGEEGVRLLQNETDAARRLGIFGAPTFCVGREIFWGDDRFEEALEYAKSPSART